MLEAPRELLLLAPEPLNPPPPLKALELREPPSLETLRLPTRSPFPLELRLPVPPACRLAEPALSRMAACCGLPVLLLRVPAPPFCRFVGRDWRAFCCRFAIESPRAVPPYCRAVARSE